MQRPGGQLTLWTADGASGWAAVLQTSSIHSSPNTERALSRPERHPDPHAAGVRPCTATPASVPATRAASQTDTPAQPPAFPPRESPQLLQVPSSVWPDGSGAMRRKKGDNQGIPHPPGTGWAQSCNITKTGTAPARRELHPGVWGSLEEVRGAVLGGWGLERITTSNTVASDHGGCWGGGTTFQDHSLDLGVGGGVHFKAGLLKLHICLNKPGNIYCQHRTQPRAITPPIQAQVLPVGSYSPGVGAGRGSLEGAGGWWTVGRWGVERLSDKL